MHPYSTPKLEKVNRNVAKDMGEVWGVSMPRKHILPKAIRGLSSDEITDLIFFADTDKLDEEPCRDATTALAKRKPRKDMSPSIYARGKVTGMVAPAGSGKTFLTLHASVCHGMCIPWFGRGEDPGGISLVIDEENGKYEVDARIGAVIRGLGGDETVAIRYRCDTGLNFYLDPRNSVKRLVRWFLETGADICHLDALSDIMLGGNLNSATDLGSTIKSLQRIARVLNVSVSFLHNFNKGNKVYQGNAILKDFVDILVEIVPIRNSNFITYKTIKNRSGPKMDPFVVEVKYPEHDPIQVGDTFIAVLSDNYLSSKQLGDYNPGPAAKKVLWYLLAHGNRALRSKLVLVCPSAKNTLKPLESNGYIAHIFEGTSDNVEYELTSAGQRFIEGQRKSE